MLRRNGGGVRRSKWGRVFIRKAVGGLRTAGDRDIIGGVFFEV
jgi:hypothetical protein